MEGYAIRYAARLASPDGLLYEAALWQRGYAGAPVRATLTERAASIKWGEEGSDVYAPLFGSVCHVEGWRVDGDADAFADALLGGQQGEWRLELTSAADAATLDAYQGDRVWLGVVQYDQGTRDAMRAAARVDVRAVCGLGALGNAPFYDTETTPGTRRATIPPGAGPPS